MSIPAHITDPIAHVRALHDHYVARSGQEIRYNPMRENTWKDWLAFCDWQWGKDEISMVIFYLREEIKRQKRNDGALKFSNLIGSPDFFEQDLALAKKDRHAAASIRKPPAKPHQEPGTKNQEPAPKGLTNSFGEEVTTGADHFASLLRKQP